MPTVTLNPTWETFHFLWGHLAGRHPAGEGSSIQTLQEGRTSKLALVLFQYCLVSQATLSHGEEGSGHAATIELSPWQKLAV